MATLEDFLRGRNLSEDVIQKLRDDKIDHTVLLLMKDEQLKAYIPSYGDRLAAFAYCNTCNTENEGGEPFDTNHRSPLLNRLMSTVSRRRRYEFPEHHNTNEKDSKSARGTNARKPSRRINLGWMHFDLKTQTYRQVRRRNGVGSRHLNVDKKYGAFEILAFGLDLFFPEGKSKFGVRTEFSFNVMDPQLNDIGDSSIADLYQKTKYTLLRLYIGSKPLQMDEIKTNEHCDDKQDKSDNSHDNDSETDLPPFGGNNQTSTISNKEETPIGDGLTAPVAAPATNCNLDHLDVEELPDLTDSGTPTVTFNPRRPRLSLRRGTTACLSPDYELNQSASCEGQSLSTEDDEMPIDPGPTHKADIKEPETVHSILTRLSPKLLTEGRNLINVTREDVLTGGLRGFQRKTFDENRSLSVKFSDEAAIDEGGPSREFLRLLMTQIRSMPIFSGPENKRSLQLNYSALQSGTYAIVGKMIAYSIVHQGALPQFCSEMMFSVLAKGIEDVRPDIQDIADETYRKKIQEIVLAEDVTSFYKKIDAAEDLIELAGCFHMTANFDKRADLASSLTHFLLLGRVTRCYDQFCSGLKSLGVLQEVQANSSCMREVFVHMGGNQLTAAIVESQFEVEFSEPGTNQRRQEETTAANWRDFLLDIEDGSDGTFLRNVLMFATGADCIPPLGFTPPPILKFHHLRDLGKEDSENFPFGNTCANTLDLPVISDFSVFKRNMIAALNVTLFTCE